MKLAPSLLAADLSRLLDEARLVSDLASELHLDVMDGHFVPNLTFGPPVVNALRRHITIPFNIHLMIEHPVRYASQFHVGPNDVITFHVEAKDSPDQTIHVIRELGCRVGISLRPRTLLSAIFPYLNVVDLVLVMSVEPGFGGQGFMPNTIPRIRALRQEIGDRPVEIAVDGGIDPDNVCQIIKAGAEIIIAGTAIYGQPDPRAAAHRLIQAARCTKRS